MEQTNRSSSEVLRKGYSDEEVSSIYELARLHLENGQLAKGEAILDGLVEVSPDFAPAWLAKCYLSLMAQNLDKALFSARQALRIQPDFVEAILFLVACLMSVGDFNSAGTHLGEVGERIEAGMVTDPEVIRLYKAQLIRFQNKVRYPSST
ncbi:MAG: hypothetical protein KDD55_10995 [Bdellovibrionales bacterium]|nr:hypothetical protein [Bdellovibrionales bacterium]